MIFGMPGRGGPAQRRRRGAGAGADRRAAVGARAGAGAMSRGDILIVEDSRTQAAAAAAPAASRPATDVRVARDGVAALELAREHPPGARADRRRDAAHGRLHALPHAQGRPRARRTPVILLTSLSSPQDVIEGLACGADNFVRKPYDGASLLARVERALADVARARARAGPGRPPRDRRRARAGDRLPLLDLRGDRPPRRRADALLPLARPALPAHGRASTARPPSAR